ncbi:stage III sporulation protein AF [Paenibacillus sp. IHBB 3054]|uniref:stage III sporulation protein AF n=1 Tax=Paenibacillus sp. IHBB 3054 TaxID=3425689 RepID=UPI003F66F1C8
MTWLGGWLRELILVVLMAAFVEMLLPSKSMERYARLVLSLLVLLTMLSPIVSFLKGDAAAELSVAMVQQEKHGGLLSGAGDGADSLEKILADGRMLAAGAKEQSLKLAAEEVAGQMRDQIAGSTGVGGAKVTVTLGMGKAPGEGGGEDVPLISSVTVSLPAATGAVEAGGTGAEPDNGAGTAEPIIIQPVEPVQVSLGGGEGEAAEVGTEAGASVEDSSSANTDEEMIIKLLEQNWNLDRDAIHIQGGKNGAEKL